MYTIEHILLSPPQPRLISTSMRSSKALTGSTSPVLPPAVSDAAAELTEKALIAAKKHGVKVSVDLNFRKKLWSSEKAQKVMTNLMKYVDVCIGNEEDAELVLGFKPGDTDVTSGELELRLVTSPSSRQMVDKFNFEYCVSSSACKAIPLPITVGLLASTQRYQGFYHSKELQHPSHR